MATTISTRTQQQGSQAIHTKDILSLLLEQSAKEAEEAIRQGNICTTEDVITRLRSRRRENEENYLD